VKNVVFFTLMINLVVVSNIISAVTCLQGLSLWRNNSVEVNDELFKGNWKGNPERMTNEIAAGLFHFLLYTYA